MDNMSKVRASQILKKGVKLESRDYDFNTPEAQEKFRKVREKQKAILKSKEVSLEDLRKIVINI